MCAPAQAQNFQNNIPLWHKQMYAFIYVSTYSARGTICAPSKNMCAPAQAQNFQNNMPLWHKHMYAFIYVSK